MSDYKPFDVVLAGVRVGNSIDPRPCIVILEGEDQDTFLLLPCSAQFDLCKKNDFKICAGDLDFAATGLPKSCYVI